MIVKRSLLAVAMLLVAPGAILELIARWIAKRDVFFRTHGQLLSLVPGRPGWLLRNAYYKLLLRKCTWDCCYEFGSMMHHSAAEVGDGVYIGVHSTIGRAIIGRDTMLADFVQVLSGRHQHGTGSSLPYQDQPILLTEVVIGRNCWVGTQSIIMADVGDNCIIGAGSVVTRPIPPNCVAAGSPARVIRLVEEPAETMLVKAEV